MAVKMAAKRYAYPSALEMNGEEHRKLTKTYGDAGQILLFRSVNIGYNGERMSLDDNVFGHDLHTRLHSDTGRLSINLKRVFAIREAPVPINLQSLQGCGIPLKMKGSLVNPYVYLIGPGALHTTVRVDDEVWILETPDIQKVFLVLRRNGEPQTFSLVATCYYVFCIFYEPVSKHQPLRSVGEVNHIANMRLSTLQMQRHMHWDYEYIRKMFNMQFRIDRTIFRHFLRFVMRASEEDGYEVPRLPRKGEGLPGRWEEFYVSSFQPDVESWIDGDYCYLRMHEDSESFAHFECTGWEVVSQGEYITFRREMLQIEKEYETVLSSPTINKYLRICLSVCRRTYGDYALRDINMLTLETTYGYKDGGKADNDWDRWFDLPDELFSYYVSTDSYKFVNSNKSDMGDFAPDALFRDFELDGSQYRVTIV
jgi:hypothetical protein